ncbi:MAG: FecR family protein [Cyclobacteriaceae bacterium]|nr:FecR family protein [Cyclobacteriaceae bacterium]
MDDKEIKFIHVLLKDPSFRKWVNAPEQDDIHYWNKQMLADPDKIPLYQYARNLLQNAQLNEYLLNEVEIEEVWLKIQAEVVEGTKRHHNSKASNSKNTHKIFSYWRSVAAIILVASLTYIIIRLKDDTKNATVTQTVHQEFKEIKANYGQKTVVKLSDGSRITLNSGSSLVYPKYFSDGQRVVTLKGEGYFDIKSNPSRPFVVETNHLQIIATGTSFNIRSHNHDKAVVSLISGIVQIRTQMDAGIQKEIQVEEGQSVYADATNEQWKTKYFNIKEVTSWKDGVLFFRDADHHEVFSELEKWYDYKFLEKNMPAKPWKFNGEFKNMDLLLVLQNLSYSMHFSYSIKDKTVIVQHEN